MKRPQKILIGSIFTNDIEPRQQHWFELQTRYIKATTEVYEHIVCITSRKHATFFEDRVNVIYAEADTRRIGGNGAHAVGLNVLTTYFKERKGEFDCYTILDSDAFPIKRGWVNLLMSKMVQREKEIAAPIRLENLEMRAHPSILVALPQALSFMHFEVAWAGYDILNNKEGDSCMPEYEGRRRNMIFPLLRSNQYNIDPFYCAIYYDMFYHHSCGSREGARPRGRKFYWSHVKDVNPAVLMDKLFKNSTEFINKLAGWSPDLYPTAERH